MPGLTLSVTQLNTYVKSLLESDPRLSDVYVVGEISNFTDHARSGHLYLSLKDDGALVRAVMFRSAASRLRFAPQNGMRVLCRGRISLYDRDGQYQYYIEDMQPDGVGALSVAFEQLKQKLAGEGLFDPARKKAIPAYPDRIAVVTSPTGAAVQDILKILRRRYPIAEVLLCPVLVQGDAAPRELIAAVETVGSRRCADVIIIGRGGGSMEELWAFNDEGVARAIARCPVPVISAVGHETDFTICDFVSDLRAPTPSAAAELAVPERTRLMAQVAGADALLRREMAAVLERQRERWNAMASRPCLRQGDRLLSPFAQRLDGLCGRLRAAGAEHVRCQRQRQGNLVAGLEALSPLKVLSRGYAMTMRSGRPVVSAADSAPGDRLELLYHDGRVECEVLSSHTSEKEDSSCRL